MRLRLLLVVLAAVVASLLVRQPNQADAQSDAGATDTARGVVFEDLNTNGGRDEGEPGVEDVSVSNGRDVTRTDADGRYSLVVDDETILFITKPSGYMVPVNEVQLPQFYYIHYPNGTPLDLEYPGIAPTGPLPESVDFALTRQVESDSFEALVFADPQTRNFEELDDFEEDVVAELVGSDAAFGLTVGDIVNDPLDLFPRHNEIVSTIGVPWWNLPGNHDINYDVPDDTYSTQTYQRVFGPTDYSADYGQVHFVNMDNVDYFGEEQGGYQGFLNETQLEWLENDLAHVPEDKLIVIASLRRPRDHGRRSTTTSPDGDLRVRSDPRSRLRRDTELRRSGELAHALVPARLQTSASSSARRSSSWPVGHCCSWRADCGGRGLPIWGRAR